MSSYRMFRRCSWQNNPSWPDGLEPAPHPADQCNTQATADTIGEARDWCGERNAKLPENRRARLLGGMYEFESS